ncbi:MAG: PilN domain-containing protein [Syntrophothermus sp.]
MKKIKPVVCIYCEGNDTKLAVITKEDGNLKVLRTASMDFVQPEVDVEDALTSINLDDDELSMVATKSDVRSAVGGVGISGVSLVQSALQGFNLNEFNFIPAITEPQVYFHVYEGSKSVKSATITENIADEIARAKNIHIPKENLGYVELADRSLLSVVINGEVGCIKLINNLANVNGKRYYKIPSVKCSDVSLAYYAAKRKKFFPDDNSLVVYIGKEYSKLIFLQGRRLKHIGSTIDIGTTNLHTYDVYFSKILLEMENGGITQLDNIVVCGEDDSENLILSFYGTFPEANVSRLEFDNLDISDLDPKSKELISSFSVPIAVAQEYYDEAEGTFTGLNLLPKYVKEEQKLFQLGWHSYAMLPVLFAAALFVTTKTLENTHTISQLDQKISKKTILLNQNKEIVNQISELETKISLFDQTQTILDSVAVGTEVWNNLLKDVSNFFSSRKNVWLSKVVVEDSKIVLEGFSLTRGVLTDFAYFFKTAELKSVTSEEIRDKTAYKFKIIFNISSYQK